MANPGIHVIMMAPNWPILAEPTEASVINFNLVATTVPSYRFSFLGFKGDAGKLFGRVNAMFDHV